MKVLGIETSCDETAAAIVEYDKKGKGHILSNIVWSQISEHQKFGGVVPEIAARAHTEKLDAIIKQALLEAKITLTEIQAIAVSAGPGLIGGLMVGLISVKAMCLALDKPLIAINHLEAHALTARLTDNVAYPYLLLLVSGGHTQLLLVEKLKCYKRLGSTIDDALGETFDKVAKLLGLSYPGGAKIEQLALRGDSAKYNFPHPLKDKANLDFSFSGLKNALRICIENETKNNNLSNQTKANICASFQAVICDILNNRVNKAMDLFKNTFPTKEPSFVIAGGVAANQMIRVNLRKLSTDKGLNFVAPPVNLCTDNAAMVAWAGCEALQAGLTDDLNISAKARWPLDNEAIPLIGSGKKGAKV